MNAKNENHNNIAMPCSPINVSSGSIEPKSIKGALKFVGGNLLVELDVEEYKKGVEELRFSVFGRNYL